MDFIQDHEAVIAGKPGMNRSHALGDPIAPEQKAGTELIHRGDDHPRLIRAVCPFAINGDPPAQRSDAQGLAVAQHSQSILHERQHGGVSRLNAVTNPPCPFTDLIDDDPPINDEHDPSGSGLRLHGHGEYRRVEHGSFAGTGREIDDFRPFPPLDHLRRQSLLPRERLVAMDIPEECSEVRGRSLPCHERRAIFVLPRIGATHQGCACGLPRIRAWAPVASDPGPGTVLRRGSTDPLRDARRSPRREAVDGARADRPGCFG